MTIYWHVGGPKRSIFRSVILAGSSFSPKIRVMCSGSADVGGRRVVGCNFQGSPTFLTGRRRHHKPRAERAVGVHAPVATLPKYCLDMWCQSDLNVGIYCRLIAFLNVSTICSTFGPNLIARWSVRLLGPARPTDPLPTRTTRRPPVGVGRPTDPPGRPCETYTPESTSHRLAGISLLPGPGCGSLL